MILKINVVQPWKRKKKNIKTKSLS